MTDFSEARGFEDVWRPVARASHVGDLGVLARGVGSADANARLARIAARAPEVMVKITGRTRDGGHLQAHLAYISRDGSLPLEGPDGERLIGLAEVRELGADWAAETLRSRRDSSLSLSVVLSMPPGTSLFGVRDAARTFAADVFGDRFDYAFAVHADADHPHVHLAVRMLGRDGERLNPRKADLEIWRQTFARALRDRDIAAEATPRRSRGVVRRAEVISIRKLRERHEGGQGPPPRVLRAAQDEAARIARGELVLERPWEAAIVLRQQSVRRAYMERASLLAEHGDDEAKRLAAGLRAFVASMGDPLTRREQWVGQVRREERRPRGLSDAQSNVISLAKRRGEPDQQR